MAVVFLYAKDGETLIALDATTNVERSRSASLTKSTIQSGATVADHYHADLPITNFSGVITDSKIRNVTPSVRDFANLVDELIDSKEPFILYGTPDGAIPDMKDALITSFSILRDTNHLNSLVVNFTVGQADIGMSAKKEGVTLPSKTTEGQLASGKKSGTGTKTEASIPYTQAKEKQLKKNAPPTTPPVTEPTT